MFPETRMDIIIGIIQYGCGPALKYLSIFEYKRVILFKELFQEKIMSVKKCKN
jgi:hypothetical protein